MRVFKLVVFLIILAILFAFSLQNLATLAQTLSFKANLYFKAFGPINLPVYTVILLTFFISVIVVGFVSVLDRWRLKREIKRFKRKCADLEKELNGLRNLPFTETPSPSVSNTPGTEAQEGSSNSG